MFKIKLNNNVSECESTELMTSGSVKSGEILFTFSPEWNNLRKTAVFETDQGYVGEVEILNENEPVVIPSEAFKKPYVNLYVGVFGENDVEEDPPYFIEYRRNKIRICSTFTCLGQIELGARK